jgi:8-oxo-dGTP pyrophosphatase MutT (NUDIX family)
VRPGQRSPLEVYMIRRQKSMRFLGGYYAFPGGAVDPADRTPEAFARCRGLTAAEAERAFPSEDGLPALAFWVTAARELLEETGVLLASDEAGRPIDAREAAVAARVDKARRAVMAGETAFPEMLAREGWWLDLGPLRYLSHFITPPSSPIRFTARFFLAPVPVGQALRHFDEEAAEAFWINPREGWRRFRQGEMPMAEPADCGLAYLSLFESLESLWAAHADGRHKFHGILDRVEAAGVEVRRQRGGRPS